MDNNERQKEQTRLRSKKYREMKSVFTELNRMQYVQEQVMDMDNLNDSDHSDSLSRDLSIDLQNEETVQSNTLQVQEDVESDMEIDNRENNLFQNLAEFNNDDRSSDSPESSSDSDDAFEMPEMPQYNPPPEIEKLRNFALKVSQQNMDELLSILRPKLLPTLPKTTKTFLRTVDAEYNIIEMRDSKGNPGQFVYFGLKQGLQNCVNPELHPNAEIELVINADGMPIKRSGDDQFWPLCCKVHFDPDIYDIFAIAIFLGQAKPGSIEEYLEDFVEEINELLRDGIIIAGIHLRVVLKCIICDTPARAFLKQTLGHKGKEACERCEVVGDSVEGTTVFPSTEATKRTNESFRNFRQPRHHHAHTPLERIQPPVDLVAIFILDIMHLLFLGIMKKLIQYWTDRSSKVKLSVDDRNELNRRMESLTTQIPIEFQRKSRSTSSIAKWKATELRFFLLYCGPIVLKKLLNDELYDHFLTLHTASRILCSKEFCHKYNEHASLYLKSFFTEMKRLYGATSQTLNSHHLLHINEDVTNMGCNLSLITAFQFESFLGKLKKKLRTPNRPLAQVCRRLHEERTVMSKKKVTLPPLMEVLNTNANRDVTKIKYKETTISTDSPNNMVLLRDGNIVSVTKIFFDNDNLKLRGQIWNKKKPIYDYPTCSGKFNMWNLHNTPSNRFVTTSITSVTSKFVKLEMSFKKNDPVELFVVPFLH